MKSKLTKNQKKTFTKMLPDNHRIEATVRYDDQCGNGNNSFAITGTVYSHQTSSADRYHEIGGCIHEEIAKHFPELRPLIKWHLTSSDGPMHYIANTTYHARDTDHNGLKKGEYGAYVLEIVADLGKKELSSIYTSGQIYTNKQNNPNLEKSNVAELAKIEAELAEIKKELNPRIIKKYSEYSLSEGKEVDIEAARSCAVWPDATLEQLRDEEQLKARLPALMVEFKHAVESLGFTF